MRPADKHLSPQELESLLFGVADSNDIHANRASAREAQQHLGGCAICQTVADRYRNVDAALRGLRGKGKRRLSGVTRGKDCPADEVWPRIAVGLIPEKEASDYVAHAAVCDWCGPLLQEAMEDLAQDMTVEEQKGLSQLSSASLEWQREMGKKMAAQLDSSARRAGVVKTKAAGGGWNGENGTPALEDKTPGIRWWPRLAWSAVAVAFVAAVIFFAWVKTGQADVNKLLAQSYRQHRTIELRMPGAEYGPIRLERGNGSIDFPPEFYEAQAIIKRQSAKHPDDPVWLHAQARVHLLQWNYVNAIKELDDALMLKPDDPDLLLDRATALFQRAEKSGRPSAIDYGEAAEDLSRVLKQKPDDAVALFNRAIIFEKLFALNRAIADLNSYLAIDGNGPWADEARERLERLRKMVQAHDRAQAEPLVSVDIFTRLAGNPDALVQLDSRLEDYLEVGIREWLPLAFTLKTGSSDSVTALNALRTLADIASTRHKDTWLTDLLDFSNRTPDFASGVGALSRAILKSGQGDPAGAYVQARSAEDFFVRAGDEAGVLRAEIEEVHALQRSQHGDKCLNKARSTWAGLRKTAYRWMRAQLEIDQSACSIMSGGFGQARSFISRAGNEVADGSFRELQLRRIGIASAVETDQGNMAGAWALDQEGLAEYWQGKPSPPIRGHQFYTDLSIAAEDLQLWNLALAMALEGEREVSLTQNKPSEALTHVLVGNMALRAQALDLARAEFDKANEQLAALPPSDAVRTYRLDAEIDLASVELAEGRLNRAEERLKSVEGSLAVVLSYTIPLRFYEIEGQLFEKQERIDQAETAFLKAVAVANLGFQHPAHPADRYTWSQETSRLYRELVQSEFKKGDPEKALQVWERYRAEALHNSMTAEHEPDTLSFSDRIHQIVSTLESQTVVSYALLPKGLAVWVLDSRGIQGHFMESNTNDLVRASNYFADMCADPSSDLAGLKRRGAALYKLLLGGVDGQLSPSRTLVIEPDEPLGDLPFEALLTQDNQYLGSRYRIVFSPGLLFQERHLTEPLLDANTKVLFVASGSNIGEEPGPITAQVEAETHAISRKFDQPVLLQADDASVERLEALLPAAEILHFAGHAISNGRQEGLLLLKASPDGAQEVSVWGAERINEKLFKHIRLAVYAACSTGRGSKNRFEKHGDIVRNTLSVGVPYVAASRWDIDSAATDQFMELFYTQLLSGKTVSIAIQRSEAAVRSRAGTQHPYYWAAFAAFGRSN